MELYDRIGHNYNFSRKADSFISSRLLALLTNPAASNGLYIDVGCGTGNYTVKLASSSMRFYGMDPSAKMLAEAEWKSDKIKWVQAFAENLPFEDAMFNGALATLTIHHWTSLAKGLAEIYRVLSPSSKLVIFTATQEQMQEYWLNHYFPVMMKDSIVKMPSRSTLADTAIQQGFELLVEEFYFIRDNQEDLFLYSGKNDPGLYFNKEVRNGISSFSSLANETETSSGLEKLQEDIRTGAFAEVKASFNDALGDYSFFVFKK